MAPPRSFLDVLATTIYIDRVLSAGSAGSLAFERKTVLLVMFIPSVERDGVTPINQEYWVDEALSMLGTVFGGATAYPRAKGIWRDDDRGRRLVRDEPVVIHCYTTPERVEDPAALAPLGSFCRSLLPRSPARYFSLWRFT